MADFADEGLLARLIVAQDKHPAVADLLREAVAEIERLDRVADGYADDLRYSDDC